ncbi:MAG TPA: hypothetical protein VKU02_03395 [Gemmataceae bacterium]|nr:hypothetical protein [Gemmataceae bacterium]
MTSLRVNLGESDRLLRVESCLALRVLDKSEGYFLVHFYRYPSDKKPEWRIRRAQRVAAWVDGSQK